MSYQDIDNWQAQVKQLDIKKNEYNKIKEQMNAVIEESNNNSLCLQYSYSYLEGQKISDNDFTEIFRNLLIENNSITEKAQAIINDCDSKITDLNKDISSLNVKITNETYKLREEQRKQEADAATKKAQEMADKRNEAAAKQTAARNTSS